MTREHLSRWPRTILYLLEKCCPEDLYEEIEGDLLQHYVRDLQSGRGSSEWKLAWNALGFFRPGILLRQKFSLPKMNFDMFQNYFKVMLRTVLRSKGYTAINVLGLTLGITCALTIFLYVYDELTFDHHHSNVDKIYRLEGGWRSLTDGSSNAYPGVAFRVAETFRKDFPEVDKIVRIRSWGLNVEKPGTDEVIAENMSLVDDAMFDVFTFPFLHGSVGTALADHNSLVISRKLALKYFGRTDAVGEMVRTIGQDTVTWKITGVYEDYPDNATLKIDMMARLKEPTEQRDDWFEYYLATFFTLKPNAQISSIEGRVKFFTKPYVADHEKEIGFTQEHFITPFSRIHLYSHLNGENNPQASTVYIFLIIGGFIMIMACINFMNLATARSMKRAKEIGVRKVIGAVRQQLVGQFLGEAFFITVVSAILSAGATYLLLPTVNQYSGKQLQLFTNPVFWTLLAGVVIVVSLFSGSYPALVLSRFKPVDVIKGSGRGHDSGQFLRKGLVVFQFVVSVSLIAGTLIVLNHLNFLRSKELGFDKEQILLIRRANEATKEQIQNIAGVSRVSFSNKVPGMGGTGRTIYNGWNTSDPQVVMDQVVVDYDYIDLYNLQILEGRGFDQDNPADQNESFLVNETALSKLGYKSAKEAIGQKLMLESDWGGKKGYIIGVLKDFHYNGVNSPILPFSMFMNPTAKRVLSVKITSTDLPGVLKQIEEVYKATAPNRAFEYSFLDQDFDRQYQAEDRFMSIFSFFAAVGIAIGCLGLYGLAMFTAEQRSKEVGIRKVLGATGKNILTLLTSDFLKLIAIAFVLAIPLTYYGMEVWLSKFPYRQNIDWMLFVLTGGSVLLITLLTISYQAIRASLINPINTLRTE